MPYSYIYIQIRIFVYEYTLYETIYHLNCVNVEYLSYYSMIAHSLNRWRDPKLDRPAVPQLQLLSYEWIITVWGRGSTHSQLP